MGTRVTVADELDGPGVEFLLNAPHGLPERRRHRIVEDPHAAAGGFCDFQPEQPRMFILPAVANCPDLAAFLALLTN